MTATNESVTASSIRAHLLAIAAATMLVVGGIGVMGASTELAGAIIASGALVVETNVKKVQHPTGGIVGELLVRDGTRVNAGDLVIRLDETAAQANVAMVSKSLAELWARRARLEAERDGIEEVEFPQSLLEVARDPEIGRVVTGERRLSSCAARRSRVRRRSCASASRNSKRRCAASPSRPPPRKRRSDSSRRSSRACAISGRRT
jgi:HlyD family secretion protein